MLTRFQTQYFSENLVTSEIEPGTPVTKRPQKRTQHMSTETIIFTLGESVGEEFVFRWYRLGGPHR
jgi:hypothetical protein